MELQMDLLSVVKLAREKTMLGEYENASSLYNQAIIEVNNAIMRSKINTLLLSKWTQTNEKLKSELNLV